MPAVVVPDLKRKFALLRTYPLPRTWPQLAAEFGRHYKTLQTWQDGKAGAQDPNRMADWALPILTRLVGAVLPGARLPDEVRQFVFGPAALLEEEVRSGPAVSLLDVLGREARGDTASLFRKDESVIGLVEIEAESGLPCPRLAFDELFRIAFRRRLPAGHLLALQHAQHVWAPLPVAVSQDQPAALLIPGLRKDGAPNFMRERRDPGRHLFVCFETLAPSPASLRASNRDEVSFDKRALDTLAAFYLEQPPRRRACHVLSVDIGIPR